MPNRRGLKRLNIATHDGDDVLESQVIDLAVQRDYSIARPNSTASEYESYAAA